MDIPDARQTCNFSFMLYAWTAALFRDFSMQRVDTFNKACVGGIWVELAVSRVSVLLSSCVLRNYYIVINLSDITVLNSDFYVVHLVCEITLKFILTIQGVL